MASPRDGLCLELLPGGPSALAARAGGAPLLSSFRDPAGFMFVEDGVYKRAVTPAGLPDYELLMLSGLYEDLARLGRRLLIEFVPKEDPMVRAMLGHRKDVFADYSFAGFLEAFGRRWELVEARPIPLRQRTLCHFRRTDEPAG